MHALAPVPSARRADERRLLRLFRALTAEERASVLNFAAFLHAQHTPPACAPRTPLPVPRPAQETVVAALKRLRHTYPMLDSAELLDDSAALVSAHLLQGRPAPDAIDELEALFARHFRYYQEALR